MNAIHHSSMHVSSERRHIKDGVETVLQIGSLCLSLLNRLADRRISSPVLAMRNGFFMMETVTSITTRSLVGITRTANAMICNHPWHPSTPRKRMSLSTISLKDSRLGLGLSISMTIRNCLQIIDGPTILL